MTLETRKTGHRFVYHHMQYKHKLMKVPQLHTQALPYKDALMFYSVHTSVLVVNIS